MIASGIYRLEIVGAALCCGGLRIRFDVDFETDVITKTFSTETPAESLRVMLESCGMTPLRGVVTLRLDSLIGLDCSGLVIGREIIEFYEPTEIPWFKNVPQYVM
jgi:hypothetical protein